MAVLIPLRFQSDVCLSYHMVVVQIFGDASDGIAAHFPLAAIQIKHPHFRIRNFRWADRYDAVPAHAGMPVGKENREEFRRLDFLLKAVNVDIVIRATVHLSKPELFAVRFSGN